MSVRKIPTNNRSITGRHAESGQEFESTLERDLLELLNFDLNVNRIEAQPLVIPYIGNDGRPHNYTPDILVHYRRDIVPAKDMPHLLCEVKYRDEYKGKFRELKPKFRAAHRYAKGRGWQFRVLTEREIRTPYLWNARFLAPYRRAHVEAEIAMLILGQVKRLGETDPQTLLHSLGHSRWYQAKLLPALWQLVANLEIATDLNIKLTMKSRIWHNG